MREGAPMSIHEAPLLLAHRCQRVVHFRVGRRGTTIDGRRGTGSECRHTGATVIVRRGPYGVYIIS